MANDDEQQPPPPPSKKLRYADADLKVVIGSGNYNDDDDDDESLVAVEEYYHSAVMAKHSSFIDTWLDERADPFNTTPTMEICFPDISPYTWKRMITLIEDPVVCRKCTIHDVLLCLPFYHKYDFPKGCELCEDILKSFLNGCLQKSDVSFGTIADACVLSHELNLTSVMPLATGVVKDVLHCSKHNTRLKSHHIEKLAPFISANLQELNLIKDGLTKDDVLSPLFPKYLLNSFANKLSKNVIIAAVTRIRLSGTLCGADGLFERNTVEPDGWKSHPLREIVLGGDRLGVWIAWVEDRWEIYGVKLEGNYDDNDGDDGFVILWECFSEIGIPLPPEDGWVPLSSFARGTPQIEYIYGKSRK